MKDNINKEELLYALTQFIQIEMRSTPSYCSKETAKRDAEEFLKRLENGEYDEDNNIINVAQRLYYEANKESKKDVPSFVYESVENYNIKRIEEKSELTLYDYIKIKQ
jgi:hypothetical protein